MTNNPKRRVAVMHEWLLDLLLVHVDEFYVGKANDEILGGYIRSSDRIFRIHQGIPIIYPRVLHRYLKKIIVAYRQIPPDAWSSLRSDWFKYLRKQQAKLILYGLLSLLRKKRVKEINILSVGCGKGWEIWLLVNYLRKMNIRFRIVGCDISLRALYEAKRIARRCSLTTVDFVCAPAEFIPFKDSTFDMVLAIFGALDHSLMFPRAFREVSRVLTSGGVFIGTVLNKFALDWMVKVLKSPSLFAKTVRYANRLFARIRVPVGKRTIRIPTHFYNVFELNRLLAANGLKLIYLKGIFSLLPMNFKSKKFSFFHRMLSKIDNLLSASPIIRSIGRYVGFVAMKKEIN